jgi:CheY-like chemotaxis protein
MRTLKIIIIDDEEEICYFMATVLRQTGHAVDTWTSSREALAAIMIAPDFYDVVVTDHVMPGLSGLMLVNQLRLRGFKKQIVAIAGLFTPELERAYEKLDAAFLMHKPFSIEQVKKAGSLLQQIVADIEESGSDGALARHSA